MLRFKDKIGYLPYEYTIKFSNGFIRPLENFDNICESLSKKSNKWKSGT